MHVRPEFEPQASSPPPIVPPAPPGVGRLAVVADPDDDRDPAPPTIRIDRASHDFGHGVGVFDLELEITTGTIVGVVGPSGSGKTTTIRMMTGALAPSAGRVSVLGEEPRRFSARTRERIGYMPQQFSLYPDLTVRENVDFVASLFGLLFPRRRRRVREVLELVELDDVAQRRAGHLSGGMQRRLDLACALVHEPALLVLDEPTAGIDPILRRTIWSELHRLRDEGRTIVVTTQYLGEVEACDRVALISDGRLAATGTPLALRRQAAGGDILEARTEGPFDPSPLTGQGGIRSAHSLGLRQFRVVTEDAGATASGLPDLVASAGGRLVSVREASLTFDEVFTLLVNGNGHEPDEAIRGVPADTTAGSAA
jgi:ABC-2 type transport system ATP-binding protein